MADLRFASIGRGIRIGRRAQRKGPGKGEDQRRGVRETRRSRIDAAMTITLPVGATDLGHA
jgi:hypothetical protein